MEFGVELLQGDVQPVAITRNRGLGDITDYWCGFLQHFSDGRSILLMPPFYANSEDRIAFAVDGETQQIDLSYALERTDSFAQYLFDIKRKADNDRSAGKHWSETLEEEEGLLQEGMNFESLFDEP
jgi:hypothetical protein